VNPGMSCWKSGENHVQNPITYYQARGRGGGARGGGGGAGDFFMDAHRTV